MPAQQNPIARLMDVFLRQIAGAIHAAKPGSPLAQAAEVLGDDGLADVIGPSLKRHAIRVLVDEREQTLEIIDAVPAKIAETAILTEVVESVIKDIRAAAESGTAVQA